MGRTAVIGVFSKAIGAALSVILILLVTATAMAVTSIDQELISAAKVDKAKVEELLSKEADVNAKNNEQTPWESTSLTADYFFNP